MPEITPKIETIGLRNYFLLAWKWLWLLILVSGLAAGGAFVASRLSTPVYQARTKLLINEAPNSGVNDYTAILMSERQASTYAEMLTDRPLLENVVADLDLPNSVAALAKAIQVELIQNTRLIVITVEDTDPARAADIANSVAAQFIKQLETLESSAYQSSKSNLEGQLQLMEGQIQATTADLAALGEEGDPGERDRLQTTLDEYRQTYANLVLKYENIRLAEISTNPGVFHLEPAIAPKVPIRPRVLMNTAMAAVIGLMIAAITVILIEALDDTIRTPEDISRHLGLPVFGLIPSYPIEMGKPITISQPRSPVSDAYRALRANIHFASVDRPLKKLLVTSSSPGEGKSMLTVNLGVVMAQSDLKTVIADTDFRRPHIFKYMGLLNYHGLSNVLAENPIVLNGNLQAVDSLKLEVLSTGELPPNPTELLGSEKMSNILELVSERADMLLVDTPPIMVVADAAVIASRMDGVLLVIKPGVTRVAAAKNSIDQLRRAKANLLGVVLNDVNLRRDGYYRNYYGSYLGYYKGEDGKSGLLSRWRKRKTK